MPETQKTTEISTNVEFIEPAKPGFWRSWWRRSDKGLLTLLLLFVLTLPLFTPRIYATDEIEYFSYLHSIVFDHDVDFTNEYNHFINTDPQKYAGFKQDLLDKHNENNLPINVGPVGSALMWSPFYLLAHGVTTVAHAAGFKVQADGYSSPYVFAVAFGSLLYGFLGLLITYWLVNQFVPKFYAALATAVIWFASPAIFYMSLTPPMSHANSLFAISLFLFVWYRTRGWSLDEQGRFIAGQRSWQAWLGLGVLGGLATMVREQDGAVMIVAAIESIYLLRQLFSPHKGTQNNIKVLIAFAKDNSVQRLGLKNLLFLTGVVIGFVPQLVVYQFLNGHLGPSKIVSNKLLLFTPTSFEQFFRLMFDPNHGMYLWSPILLVATVGLLLMLRERRLRFVTIAFFAAFLCELYISASFKTWTMAGSFGTRRMVGISPVFVAGLAYLTYWLAEGKRGWHLARRWLVGLGIMFILWNVGLIIQFAAIRDEVGRQNLDIARAIGDQFGRVPAKIFDVAQNFLFHRSSFYKKTP